MGPWLCYFSQQQHIKETLPFKWPNFAEVLRGRGTPNRQRRREHFPSLAHSPTPKSQMVIPDSRLELECEEPSRDVAMTLEVSLPPRFLEPDVGLLVVAHLPKFLSMTHVHLFLTSLVRGWGDEDSFQKSEMLRSKAVISALFLHPCNFFFFFWRCIFIVCAVRVCCKHSVCAHRWFVPRFVLNEWLQWLDVVHNGGWWRLCNSGRRMARLVLLCFLHPFSSLPLWNTNAKTAERITFLRWNVTKTVPVWPR